MIKNGKDTKNLIASFRAPVDTHKKDFSCTQEVWLEIMQVPNLSVFCKMCLHSVMGFHAAYLKNIPLIQKYLLSFSIFHLLNKCKKFFSMQQHKHGEDPLNPSNPVHDSYKQPHLIS